MTPSKPKAARTKTRAKTSKNFVLRVAVTMWDPATRSGAKNAVHYALEGWSRMYPFVIKSARVTNADIP